MRSARLGCLAALILAVSTGCNRQSSTEDKVRQFSERFVHESLALFPVEATGAGYHRHGSTNLDGLLDDYSLSGIGRAATFYDHALGEVYRLTDSRLPEESQADLGIIRQQCELQLFEINKMQTYRHNPMLYVETIGNALYTPFILAYAPESERFADIASRLEKIPAFLATAKANLEDAPRIWNEVAQQENEGNIGLIDKTIRAQVPAELKRRYDAAAARALAALRAFNAYLQNDLSHREGDWRLGPDHYTEKFRITFSSGETPQQVLAEAEAQIQKVRADMYAQAAALYGKYFPGQNVPSDANTTISAVLKKIAAVHATLVKRAL